MFYEVACFAVLRAGREQLKIVHDPQVVKISNRPLKSIADTVLPASLRYNWKDK